MMTVTMMKVMMVMVMMMMVMVVRMVMVIVMVMIKMTVNCALPPTAPHRGTSTWEPVDVNLFGKKVFEDVIQLRTSS